MSDDDELHYEPVMPFLNVQSVGGQFEDQAFCAGWECGVIDTELAFTVGKRFFTVRIANLPQLDLIAMKNGFKMAKREADQALYEGWAQVVFESVSGGPAVQEGPK
jgi:hypothetical protein